MIRQPNHRPPRPSTVARRAPRTRAEAATELVRIEFERDRLKRELVAATQRQADVRRQLSHVEDRARMLHERLAGPAQQGSKGSE